MSEEYQTSNLNAEEIFELLESHYQTLPPSYEQESVMQFVDFPEEIYY